MDDWEDEPWIFCKLWVLHFITSIYFKKGFVFYFHEFYEYYLPNLKKENYVILYIFLSMCFCYSVIIHLILINYMYLLYG